MRLRVGATLTIFIVVVVNDLFQAWEVVVLQLLRCPIFALQSHTRYLQSVCSQQLSTNIPGVLTGGLPVCFMGGPIVNKIGVKWALVLGAMSFPIEGSAYYCNSKFGNQWVGNEALHRHAHAVRAILLEFN